MADHSPVIFDSNENIEEEEPEKEEEEEEEEEEEGERSSSSEEKEKCDKDYDPWEDLREPYTKEVQRFPDMGKTQDYAENAAFNTLLPLSRKEAKKKLLTVSPMAPLYQTRHPSP